MSHVRIELRLGRHWRRAPGPPVRLVRGRDTLDLFFAFDPFHQVVVGRAMRYPFSAGDRVIELPFLSANDLVAFKISFNRRKDWADIEAMVAAGTPIDVTDIQQHLFAFRGPAMYPRIATLRQLLAQA
jgi:hypothetical protein